jgi:hypothetical protein
MVETPGRLVVVVGDVGMAVPVQHGLMAMVLPVDRRVGAVRPEVAVDVAFERPGHRRLAGSPGCPVAVLGQILLLGAVADELVDDLLVVRGRGAECAVLRIDPCLLVR